MYVHRRDSVIASVHSDRQPGYADEELEDEDPELVAWLAAANDPVPQRVSAGSFVRALYDVGKIAAVKAAVAAAGGLAEDLWLHASSFVRSDPMIDQIGAVPGVDMDAAAIDDLFRRAGVHDRETNNG